MIAPNIDIPAGLEQAYNAVVNRLGGLNSDAISKQKYVAKKRSYFDFANNSLFILWQDLYNGLPSLFKVHWTTFWETLPFGTHGGLHGYPGSGFSAFVYLNAPRYKLGQSLILDPYPATNIIPNGDFSAGANNWFTQHVSITDKAIFDPAFSNAVIITTPNFNVFQGHTYRFSAFIGGTFGNLLVGITFSGTHTNFIYNNFNAGVGYIQFDFTILTLGAPFQADAFAGDNTNSDAVILFMSLVDIT
jgi:hypothetical protein